MVGVVSKTVLLAALCVISGTSVGAHDQHVVCYVATWAAYRPTRGTFSIEDVDPRLCTQVVYSFLGIDEHSFQLKSLDEKYDLKLRGFEKALALKNRNPSLKVTVAVGGWTEGSEKYSAMAMNPASRRAFIQSVVNFFKQFPFDGLDLDWEYPANRGGKPEDRRNFVTLVREMRPLFTRNNWILTAALGAGKSIIDSAYDVPRLSKYLDYIHLMTYDYHGKWDMKTGHNAPLYPRLDETPQEKMLNVNYTVRYYVDQGAPVEKLILGLGLYGRSFLLNDTSNPGIGAPTRKSAFSGQYTKEDGFLGFNEICEKLLTEKWSIAWQEAHQAPYMFRDNMWIGFDDVNSLGIKVAYAQRLGLGGVMAWSVDTDDFLGVCGEPYPLLRSINHNLDLHSKNRFQERIPTTSPSTVDYTEYDHPSDYDNYYDLDKDKPFRTDIDFDVDNSNVDQSRYYPVSGRNRDSSAVSITSSVGFILSAVVALLLTH